MTNYTWLGILALIVIAVAFYTSRKRKNTSKGTVEIK